MDKQDSIKCLKSMQQWIPDWDDREDGLSYWDAIDMAIAALSSPNEPLISGFDVIDTKTGEYPDLWEIALKEDWANGLMYCDMEGFAIEEDGTLLLLDECGKQAYCPKGRFKIVPRQPEGEEDT